MGKENTNNFAGKKVLVFGLGLLGGGVATTNWLIKHGAKVTVTDLKNKEQLAVSLKRIKGRIKLKLGGHDERDISENDVIVFNPDIPVTSKYVLLAHKLGKQVENEATIFYKLCSKPIIAVTGTRGKTTTANWAAHFLNSKGSRSVLAGNSFVEPLLNILDNVGKFSIVVNEIPSYHLEFFDSAVRPPGVAVVTNVFQDHLNRYSSFLDYAMTKGNIFKNQTSKQNLVLNYSNKWTQVFLKQKPQSKIWFFSMKKLPKRMSGVFYVKDGVYLQSGGVANKILNITGFVKKWGEHNLENLLASGLAAYLGGALWRDIQQKIKTLPQIPFRQEVIFQNKNLIIINDTTATSPDGGIAAVKRFASPSCILITGGTDRQLDYKQWAKMVPRHIKPGNIIMLAGSATDKMLKYLGDIIRPDQICDTLADCIALALSRAGKYSKSVVLFSPAAKSFEKFKNEFDRGQQFNKLIKKEVGKWMRS